MTGCTYSALAGKIVVSCIGGHLWEILVSLNVCSDCWSAHVVPFSLDTYRQFFSVNKIAANDIFLPWKYVCLDTSPFEWDKTIIHGCSTGCSWSSLSFVMKTVHSRHTICQLTGCKLILFSLQKCYFNGTIHTCST